MMASSGQNTSRASASGKYCIWCKLCKVWWNIFKWLPVLFIVTVVVWSYYAYVIQLCYYTVDSNIEKLLYLIFYHVLIIMFLWSYWQVIFTDIIPVPDKFKIPQSEMEKLLAAENEDAQRIILESFSSNLPVVTRELSKKIIPDNMLELFHKMYPNAKSRDTVRPQTFQIGKVRTLSGAVRFCHRCAIIKPDRAHHCSMCGVCVLKMDHHCPWINNCVCFHNYKFFVLFLGYALLYCVFVTATAMQYFVQFWKGGDMTHGLGKFHVIFVFFVALMFAISLGSLFSYHCYLVLHNRSTIEAFRAPMFRSGPDKNGFSLGTYQNLVQVFGADPKKWLLPIFTSVNDGSEFPVKREHEALPTQYQSMATTNPSLGEGIAYPQRTPDEDTESLLSSEQWEERAHPFSQQERPFRQHDRPYVHHERPFADNDSSGSFDDL